MSTTETTNCGFWKFHLKQLQCCATILCFTGIYSLSSLTTSTLSIYISSQITTLEKQFGFTSSQSGFILSCNDIGFLAVTLFVSYRATSVHIPRALGFSTILYGLAGILCSFAYFLKPENDNIDTLDRNSSFEQHKESALQFCNENKNHTSGCDSTNVVSASSSFTPVAILIIAIGMISQGIGKSPRSPYISYYIDENVDKRKTSLYLGAILGIGIFGPALGFGLGAVFNNMYVTLQEVDITPRDPRWIGAWWLGFLIFGIVGIILAFPLFCFPNRYHGNKSKEEEKIKLSFIQHIKEFVRTSFRLFKNGCYTFTLLASCLQMLIIASMISFMPKYLETQFTIPAWHANVLMGGLNVFSASVGTIIGGYVVYRLRMTPYGCIKFVLILATGTAVLPVLGYVVGCDNPEIIGYNSFSTANLSSCIEDCNCDQGTYFPVCGSDNKNYFSYCHAGCTGRDSGGFTDCTCIGTNATASPGLCSPECDMLYVYIVIAFVFAMVACTAIMPEYIFVLRCVEDRDKAMAVAFRTLATTLLGWFPGPVITGKIVDTCCQIWNTNCGTIGACSLYDITDFRYKRHSLDLGIKSVAVIFYFIAFLFTRKRKDLWENPQNDKEIVIVPEGENLLNGNELKQLDHKISKE